jgi:hypothetical protein
MESHQSIRDSGNSRFREIAILAIRDYGKSRFWQLAILAIRDGETVAIVNNGAMEMTEWTTQRLGGK